MTANVCEHTVGSIGRDGALESSTEVERQTVRFGGAFAIPVAEETWPKWADADELLPARAEAELDDLSMNALAVSDSWRSTGEGLRTTHRVASNGATEI